MCIVKEVDFPYVQCYISDMSNILHTMEKVAELIIVPNFFHPVWNNPKHPEYRYNGAVLNAMAGAGLTGLGVEALRKTKHGFSTWKEALESADKYRDLGADRKMTALMRTKAGRLGAGLLGVGLGVPIFTSNAAHVLGMNKKASPFLHPEVHKAMIDTHNGLLQDEADKTLRDGILVGTGAGAGAGSILAGIGKKLGKNISKTKFGLLTGAGALVGGTGFGLLANQAAKRFDQFKIPQPEEQ